MAEKRVKTKTLDRRGSYLSQAANQIKLLEKDRLCTTRFGSQLKSIGEFPLKPQDLEILQVNLGYMCDLTCEHCHVDAGPGRKEIMTKTTMQRLLEVIDATGVKTVDLTGGAPEMNPEFKWFVEALSARNVEVLVRSNLTILVSHSKYADYPEFFKKHNVQVIASLPCYTRENVDKQRGNGVFSKSIQALEILNELGYGKEGTGLMLNLVFNPGGPSLPPPQEKLQADYKRILKEDFGLEFNHLYTITNLPISRFLDFLLAAERYEEYMDKLLQGFNPAAVKGVMCRNTLSVSWDGYLYDCDFNQMLQLKVAAKQSHVDQFDASELQKRDIVVGQHCYGCTAGAGSSCQGAIL